MNKQQVDTFLKLQSQLKSAYDEITILSKKSPTDVINKFKLKFINSILLRANELLEGNYIPFPEDFSLFDEDDMPNNSDVVFILSHYLTTFEKVRSDNIGIYDFEWYWIIDGSISSQKTNEPTIK
jgi:hypothetical protein